LGFAQKLEQCCVTTLHISVLGKMLTMETLGSKRNKRSPLVGCVSVPILAVLFIVALVFGSDQYCRYEINQRLPIYPGATLVSKNFNGLRARATGASQMVYNTPDDVETVKAFYRELNLERVQRERPQGIATVNFLVEPNPQGEGSVISYATECGI
jgi:hypothetical protein